MIVHGNCLPDKIIWGSNMNSENLKGFFAYPSDPPTCGEVITEAIKEINAGGTIEIKTWEELQTGGKFIIHEICKEIDQTDLFCADLTGMNPNVLFELGYAIAHKKRIWLVFDTSFSTYKKQFDQFRLLTTIGYEEYQNSRQIIDSFYKSQPHRDLEITIFDQLIGPSLQLDGESKLLYLKNRHNTEASVRLTRFLERSKMPLIVDDPQESQNSTITWYGVNIFSAIGVICHLMHPDREGALQHNIRYAFAAGLAHGMNKPLIMLLEGSSLSPLDYRELLFNYTKAVEALKLFEVWYVQVETDYQQKQLSKKNHISTVKLATELKSLQLGEPIAENEIDQLVYYYFIETVAYNEAVEGKDTVFVGRKGAGKSANFFKLASKLSSDRRNLVCQIKPISYQLQSVADLIRRYKELSIKTYAIESLWKFLIYSELANTIEQDIKQRKYVELSADENFLLKLMEQNGEMLRQEFSIRLERCVEALLKQQESNLSQSIETARMSVSEALHEGILKELRIVLGRLLLNKKRVVVLIDNLDKSWDKNSDLTSLSEFFLGLLSAAKRVSIDFKHEDSRRAAASIGVTIFLRSDIFYKIKEVAREPDKINYSKMNWNDPELLFRVIEERFSALHAGNDPGLNMWHSYFCNTVNGLPIKEYFLKTILLRPRDLIFFVKSAVTIAVNRGHPRVEECDVLEAEKLYSQFALDSLLVEDGVAPGSLEKIVFEFLGSSAVIAYSDIKSIILKAEVPDENVDDVIEHLSMLTFIGLEVKDGEYRFADDPQDNKKNQILARKLCEARNAPPNFKVHPAFRAFLETC